MQSLKLKLVELAEENNINPIDAMKKSADMMDGYKMKLFWCYVTPTVNRVQS